MREFRLFIGGEFVDAASNEVFETTNPSTENVALHIGKNLKLPAGVRLVAVEVWETPENSALWRPN